MQKTKPGRLIQVSQYIFLGLLAYMPLHIFLSTLIGANIGGLDFLKAAKDPIALFGFCLVFFKSVNQPWFGKWLRDKLTITILIYALLTVILAIVKSTDLDAEILGLVYNLRFPMFFLYGWLLTMWLPAKTLAKQATSVVLISGFLVTMFGIFQYLLLPNDALTHLGFTKANGVFPAFFIDNKPDLERVMSTFRDPNSLGSYLIIIISLIGAKLLSAKRNQKLFWAGYGLAAGLCLFLTFSRSALLGLVVAGTTAVLLAGPKLARHRLFKPATLGLATLVILLAGGLLVARNTYVVKNVIFHADQSTVLEDPNQLRAKFAKQSVKDIANHPLGQGPGTAGLASIKNDQATKLNEDYYLQIGTEVGLLGLVLFAAILILTVLKLWPGRSDLITVALLASFAGLAVTNLLVHIWSNEAVAYTWWGLAGVYAISTKQSKSL